jgi:1,2-phenylacetyl-CoA epoxidase catalytic subunit
MDRRLGDGTEESHAARRAAIDHLWAYHRRDVCRRRRRRGLIDAGIAIDPASARRWLTDVSDVVSEATLALPQNDWMQQGGRVGRHSEHLGHLLQRACSRCSVHFRGRHGDRCSSDAICAGAPGMPRRASLTLKSRC